jgi:monoamine oxidase
MNTEFDVAIIGGGAAEIGAARQLAASAHSTLLLEATSRARMDLCHGLHSGVRL